MSRPTTVAGVLLGFLTGLLAGQLGLLLTDSLVDDARSPLDGGRDEEVIHAFYTGINAWIATRDPAIEGLLAGDFVDRTLSGAADRNSAGLLTALDDVRSTLPSFRYHIVAVEMSGPIAAVELVGRFDRLPPIAGWSLALAVPPSFQELVRIEGGKVVERWTQDDRWPSGAVMVEHELSVGGETFHQPSVQQFTIEPGSAFDLIVEGTVMLWVASGTLGIDASGLDPLGALRPQTEPLSARTMRIVRSDGILRVRARGRDRVDLWTVSLDPVQIPGGSPGALTSDLPTGISQRTSISLAAELPFQGVRLSVTTVTLPAGTTFAMEGARLQALAVLTGSIDAQLQAGKVFLCVAPGRSRVMADAEVAHAGQGFVSQQDGRASFLVTGGEPATLLLVSIDPHSSAPPQAFSPDRQ